MAGSSTYAYTRNLEGMLLWMSVWTVPHSRWEEGVLDVKKTRQVRDWMSHHARVQGSSRMSFKHAYAPQPHHSLAKPVFQHWLEL